MLNEIERKELKEECTKFWLSPEGKEAIKQSRLKRIRDEDGNST